MARHGPYTPTVPSDTTGEAWRAGAACVGYPSEWWFPWETVGKNQPRTPGRAEAICAECPVKRECAAYARRTNTRDGIWGGKTR